MGSASTKFRKYLQNGDEYAAMQVFQNSPELQKSLNPNLSYGDSYQHNTPLHFSARHSMKHLLRTFLYDLGGNPNKKNSRNETCLHSACQTSLTKSPSAHERRWACVVLILQWRGSTLPSGEVERIDLATCDEKSNTALHYAAASGLTKCVEILVAHGAPLFSENCDKETPCDCAEKAGHENIAIFLESKMVFVETVDNVNEADLLTSLDTQEVYSGLRSQDLQEAKDQLLVETSDMLHVPLFTSEALLRGNEWSRETLLENWIKDPIACCELAGVHPPTSALQFASSSGELVTTQTVTTEYQAETLNSPIRLTSMEGESTCEICLGGLEMCDGDTVPMVCDHQFCPTCWERYLNVKIQEGDAHNIMCPAHGCPRLVPVDVIEKLVAPDMVRRYLQFDIKAFVDSNPNIKWCPFPGCGQAVRLPEKEVANAEPLHILNCQPPLPTSHAVDCGNGHFFCWECLDVAHAPCGCEKWVDWHKRIKEVKPDELKNTFVDTEQAANCLWLVSNSKPCPNCKSPIQKNEGCNHMKCSKCKFDFCWVCLEAWKKHNSATGGYFRCNRFDAVHKVEERHGILISAAEIRNKQLQELNRFVHYYTRFKNHENSHKLEEPLLKTAKEKMAMLATSMPVPTGSGGGGETETKFVECAVSELLKSRRVLCGSYVYGYYLEDNGYNRTIFEFMQNELEESTEKLAQMVARLYLQTPRAKIIQTAALVKRKRQEFAIAVSKGLIPPETPPTMRRFRRRRIPGLMGMDPVEDEQLSQAIAASLHDLDPDNPWVKDCQGRHTNLSAIYDWPDYDSDEDAEVNNVLAASILGICSRKDCTKPKARNPRVGTLHEYCSLRCSKWDKMAEGEADPIFSYTSDYQMDLLIALEMSRLQMMEGAVDAFNKLGSTSMAELPSDSADMTDTMHSSSADVSSLNRDRDSESPLSTLENVGDQVVSSSDETSVRNTSTAVVRAEPDDYDGGDSTTDSEVAFAREFRSGSVGGGCTVPTPEEFAGDESEPPPLDGAESSVLVVDGSPPSPRTNADLAVEYFLKSLGDRDGYLRNMNVSPPDAGSKADKELIRFRVPSPLIMDDDGDVDPVVTSPAFLASPLPSPSSSVTFSAVLVTTPECPRAKAGPRCSCAMHATPPDASESTVTVPHVLWEMQGSETAVASTSSFAGGGAAYMGGGGEEVFGRLKKSPTDGSLCFEPQHNLSRFVPNGGCSGGGGSGGQSGRYQKGKIGSMPWDMSMSLDTLTKKSASSSFMKRLSKSDGKKQQQQQQHRHSSGSGSQDRDSRQHLHQPKKWLNWQFF